MPEEKEVKTEDVDKVYEELIARSNEFYDSGEYEKALGFCDDAAKLKYNQGLAWYMKGMNYIKIGKYNEALAAFDAAMRADFELSEPLIGKGYVYLKLFRFEDAIKVLKDAFAKAMEVQVACLIGLCYTFIENEDEAVSWFRRAFEKDKEYTLKFFDEIYTELVIKDENITADEKIAVKTAIDKLKKKLST
ncbi:MAG: tetratricopeptide repeat protein [Candidatus Micrarchaeia archaeon]